MLESMLYNKQHSSFGKAMLVVCVWEMRDMKDDP